MYGYIFNPVVVLDREYLEDYVQATTLRGLAKKRALAELVEYRCIAACEDGVYAAFQLPGTDPLSIEAHGSTVTFIEGFVLFDVTMTEHTVGRALPAGMIPEQVSTEGWIAVDDVLSLSESEMKAHIDEMKATQNR